MSVGRSHAEQLALELANTIRILAVCAEENWCESISLPRGFMESESVESGAILIGAIRSTELGELARVDLHLLDGMPVRLHLGNLLVRETEPFIIGVGEVRVVWHEPFESLVVLRGNPFLVAGNHKKTPEIAREIFASSNINGKDKIEKESGLCGRPEAHDFSSSSLQVRRARAKQVSQDPLTPKQLAALEKVFLIDPRELCHDIRWDFVAARLKHLGLMD
jgi:hypothetical protein